MPAEIKDTFDKLGIPEAEKKYLAGVKAQFESEVVYGSLQEDLAKKGVIFTDTDTAVREHRDLVREYFGTIIPPDDNKFAALNSAVWSGGSFIYVPKGVKIEFPLQAYFRINAEQMGQFERTLIIVDEGAEVHYVEGCTAPMYTTESLHSAVVEIIVRRGARCRYTTIQNWANNIYNLVTKRAMAYGDSLMEWIDGNLGSRLTMKYPAVYMMEPGARGEILSIAFSSKGQHQDAGAKVVHCAPHTTSRIISKSISKNGGRTQLPRPVQGAERRGRLEEQRRLRRLDSRPAKPQRHLSVHRSRRAGRAGRARGERLADRRGAAVLPAEPRPHRRRSQLDDRQRLHRAAGQRAADGIRRRNEPADRAADGRERRLTPRLDREYELHLLSEIEATGFTQDAFDAFLAARDEPAWLTELRRKAWQRFLELPMPVEPRRRVDADRHPAVQARSVSRSRSGAAREPGVSARPVGRRRRARRPDGERRQPLGARRARTRAGEERRAVRQPGPIGRRARRSAAAVLRAAVVDPFKTSSRRCMRPAGPAGRCCTCPRACAIDEPLHTLVRARRRRRRSQQDHW